ncbi:MAG: PaaI family thioesterase [Proteobacteria bacterium]|nr:PaaI family thioesterase [Pseudomonadota bacterium]
MPAKSSTPMSLKDLQAFMDASPFISSSKMQITASDPEQETLTVSMPLKPEFERAPGSGQFHGGPIAALIDTAGCFALVMVLNHGVPTINFRCDYLRPAMNTSLRAIATVRRAGRTVGVVDVDVLDDSDRLVAVGRGTFGSQAG